MNQVTGIGVDGEHVNQKVSRGCGADTLGGVNVNGGKQCLLPAE